MPLEMYKHLLNVCKFINNACENVKMPNVKEIILFFFLIYLSKGGITKSYYMQNFLRSSRLLRFLQNIIQTKCFRIYEKCNIISLNYCRAMS